MNREDAKRALLDQAGYGSVRLQPLPVDCSFRSYVRLTDGPRPALLMDAPPGLEPLRPFVEISRHLRALGFSAPEVATVDFEHGYALIEDFGEATFTRRLDAGADAGPLYELAVDTLATLQAEPQAARIHVPAYDLERLLAETRLFLDWYWPAVHGKDPSAADREDFENILHGLLAPLSEVPPVLVLRDFHVDNLMILGGREGIGACGLLDFQDAVLGHPAYDLVSLLQDARRDLDPRLVAAMRARYAAAAPELVDDSGYCILGAQRHLKVFGIFTRQSRRDGKHRYLAHIERLWRLLDVCFDEEPRLKPLRQWLAHHWPPETRIVPPLPEAER